MNNNFDNKFDKFLIKNANIISILSLSSIIGAWYYYPIFTINNEKNKIIYLIILAILSLTQFIIYLMYFIYLGNNKSDVANIILGESSAWILFTPILIYSMFSLIH